MKNGFHYSRRAADLSYLDPSNPNLSCPKSKFNHLEEAGYILITYSCLISMALIIFAAGYLHFQANQVRQIEREICSIKAFYIAQAGLQQSARSYKGQKLVLPDPNTPFGDGRYTPSIKSVGTSGTGIRVTGACGMKDGSLVVKRTLEATITPPPPPPPPPPTEPKQETPFKGAVYTYTTPTFATIAGTIDGKKSSYSIRSSEAIPTELFKNSRIELIGPVQQWDTQRSDPNNYTDYKNLESKLKEKEKIFSNINNNSNKNMGNRTGQKGKLNFVDLKDRTTASTIGEYQYSVNPDGTTLGTAQLNITVPGTYELPAGTYYLTGLDMIGGSTLTGAGAVTILCVGNVRLSSGAVIQGYQGQSRNFSLECYRKSVQQILEINIEPNCQFTGTILAPSCNFLFHEGVNFKGGIIVGNVRLALFKSGGSSWRIEYDEALAPQKPPEPEDGQGQGQVQSASLINWQEVNVDPSHP
jgi:hypothetical protein